MSAEGDFKARLDAAYYWFKLLYECCQTCIVITPELTEDQLHLRNRLHRSHSNDQILHPPLLLPYLQGASLQNCIMGHCRPRHRMVHRYRDKRHTGMSAGTITVGLFARSLYQHQCFLPWLGHTKHNTKHHHPRVTTPNDLDIAD